MENTSPHTPAPPAQTDPTAPGDPTAAAWARARAAYLSGESSTVVAAQLGVSRSTLQRRAAAEGWRRCDQPRAAVNMSACLVDWEPNDPNSPLNRFAAASDREVAELLLDPDLSVYLRHAFRRSAESAAMGRVVEAQHWARLSLMLQRINANFPTPDRVCTTPDRMRAAYATALRALWGEEDAPDTLPWSEADDALDAPDAADSEPQA